MENGAFGLAEPGSRRIAPRAASVSALRVTISLAQDELYPSPGAVGPASRHII
jgi:hypothetical protein